MWVWIGIAILCVVIMFLLVLALYRLHTIDAIQKDCNEKINKAKDEYWDIATEKAKLKTFKEITENIITGLRPDSEKVSKIKELLFPKKQ